MYINLYEIPCVIYDEALCVYMYHVYKIYKDIYKQQDASLPVLRQLISNYAIAHSV